jgi:hypothetical protein
MYGTLKWTVQCLLNVLTSRQCETKTTDIQNLDIHAGWFGNN